jgi:hypothetical protein
MADLIDGGAPDGIRMRPGDDGCLTKRKRISITTMHGKSSTKPSGMDIDELPFSRIRRRKKDNRGKVLPFSLLKSSSEGRFGVDGIRFASPCTKSMVEALCWLSCDVSTCLRWQAEMGYRSISASRENVKYRREVFRMQKGVQVYFRQGMRGSERREEILLFPTTSIPQSSATKVRTLYYCRDRKMRVSEYANVIIGRWVSSSRRSAQGGQCRGR